MEVQVGNRIGYFFLKLKRGLVKCVCGDWGIVRSTNLVWNTLEDQIFGLRFSMVNLICLQSLFYFFMQKN